MIKASHPKPQFYSRCFAIMQEVAKEYGYNLVIHGSMDRDFDLIAIPEVNDPKDEYQMVFALSECVGGMLLYKGQEGQPNAAASSLPGGRRNYVIELNRGGYIKNTQGEIIDPLQFIPDPEWYIDISVTPLVKL